MEIINPATDKLITTIETDSKESLNTFYLNLKEGQKKWANVPISKRIECIAKFKQLLLDNMDDLGKITSSEVGKPIRQATGEIKGACNRIDFFLQQSEEILKEQIRYSEEGLTEKVTYEPLGVIANISAWNYPYLVGVNVFIPALIAGNAVLYKPSEFSTLTGIEIEKYLYQAGIPSDVFKCVKGKGDVGQMLLEMPLNGYYFTGSYKTGQYIYTQVAPKMVPCQMELGGKDPMYVSDHNSDVEAVAASAADGAFYNNGQSCCAVERIYVHESVYDTFINKFISEVKSFKVGDPNASDTYLGSLTRKDQIKVLDEQVKDAVSKGATIAQGGEKIDGPGSYYQPTVLTNVNHEMEVMKEESFGPVIGIQKVKNANEAISLMTDTVYGLTSSIFTENNDEFEQMAQQMTSGTVYRNCCDRVSANVPWSGRNYSGFGSTLGLEGIRAFAQTKSWQIK